jgi:hypothetical protein
MLAAEPHLTAARVEPACNAALDEVEATRTQPTKRGEEETMRKPKRDVAGYIGKLIKYELGSDTKAPPGGFDNALDRAEADLVYMSVRMTLEAVDVPLKPPWFPAGEGGERKLAGAYRNRGLNQKKLVL